MTIEEKLENELKNAMKSRDEIKVSTIRMLKAGINNVKLEKNIKALDDPGVVKIVQKQVSEHRESIEQFEKGKRDDLVSKEKKELDILLAYVPAEMPEGELKNLIAETLKEAGVTSKSEMGKAMKAVMGKVRGRADGKRVQGFVSELLG